MKFAQSAVGVVELLVLVLLQQRDPGTYVAGPNWRRSEKSVATALRVAPLVFSIDTSLSLACCGQKGRML